MSKHDFTPLAQAAKDLQGLYISRGERWTLAYCKALLRMSWASQPKTGADGKRVYNPRHGISYARQLSRERDYEMRTHDEKLTQLIIEAGAPRYVADAFYMDAKNGEHHLATGFGTYVEPDGSTVNHPNRMTAYTTIEGMAEAAMQTEAVKQALYVVT